MNFKLVSLHARIELSKLPEYFKNRLKGRVKIDAPPIFIICCAHSGSTLLTNMLQSHSRICGMPSEIIHIRYKLAFLVRFLFRLITIINRKSRWLEKSAKSVRHLDKLLKIKDAQFIVLIRDGRDVAVSLMNRDGSLEAGIQRWVHNNRLAEVLWDNPRATKVSYEDLVEDPERVLTHILDFLGEEFEPQMLEYYKNPYYIFDDKIKEPEDSSKKNHHQYRTWQVNQPIYNTSGKWKKLTEEQKDFIKNYAGDMLIEYGYVEDQNW